MGDPVRIRAFDSLQILPRGRGKAFNIAPLPFGKDGVKRQAAFARPTDTSKYHKLAKRKIQVNSLQVMDADTAQFDLTHAADILGRKKGSIR